MSLCSTETLLWKAFIKYDIKREVKDWQPTKIGIRAQGQDKQDHSIAIAADIFTLACGTINVCQTFGHRLTVTNINVDPTNGVQQARYFLSITENGRH